METWTTKSRTFRTFLLLMEMEPERIRGRLKQARKESGLTQQELADLLSVHKRSVENFENVRIPWDRLNDYAKVTNRPVEWFLFGEDAMPPEGQVQALTGEMAAMHEELASLRERIETLEGD